MHAVTVAPGRKDSVALSDVPEPPNGDGPVLVETLAVGICGTDLEIIGGEYGSAPEGEERLVLGHESLGRVIESPDGGELAAGDLVVGIVRRADPLPCPNCAAGEWDMCRNGRYTERGIKARHGYASERWRIHPEHAVKVDPALGRLGVLLEPASVVAKAWEHVERIGARAHWSPTTALVVGAGPIGLLAALLSVQRGLDTHVRDRVTEGLKPGLVADLGATYHASSIADADLVPDVVIECTGVPQLVLDAVSHNGPLGIVCLTGVSSGGRQIGVDAGLLSRTMVLENDVVFGSVNANRRHYQQADDALLAADPDWLDRLVSRRVPLSAWRDAYTRAPDDVKAVLEFAT